MLYREPLKPQTAALCRARHHPRYQTGASDYSVLFQRRGNSRVLENLEVFGDDDTRIRKFIRHPEQTESARTGPEHVSGPRTRSRPHFRRSAQATRFTSIRARLVNHRISLELRKHTGLITPSLISH